MVAPPSKPLVLPSSPPSASSSKKGRRRKLPKTLGVDGGQPVAAPAPAPAPMITPPQAGAEGMEVDGGDSNERDEAETRAMVEAEKPRLWRSLEEVRDRSKDVEEKVASLVSRAQRELEEDPGPRDDGASFLALKQTLLLSYCRELCSYAAAKGRGQALRGGGPAGRLVELRTVMEKLRPMDRKLKYQTDKMLRLATSVNADGSTTVEGGGDGDDDPLSFRPRPEGMAPWGENPTEAAEPSSASASAPVGASGQADQSGLYRAPRLASMPYDEDGVSGGAARGEKRLERRRDKLRRGEVMETLREEFGEQPETVRAVGNAGASGVSEAKMKKLQEEDKERLDFEEDHMVRLTVTRKAKKARARMEKDAGRLETIADVGSAADFVRVARDADGFGAEMEGGEDDVFGGGAGRGRKKSKALGRALGAVGGGGMSGAGTGGKGKKKQRRR